MIQDKKKEDPAQPQRITQTGVTLISIGVVILVIALSILALKYMPRAGKKKVSA